MGFFLFVVLPSNLMLWGLTNSIFMVSLIALALVGLYLVSRFRKRVDEIDKELIFEENAPAAFELLDLGRGT